MKTKTIILGVTMLLGANMAFAQGEIKTPFMLDSVNNKGEKFSVSSLLQNSNATYDNDFIKSNTLTPASTIQIGVADAKNNALYLQNYYYKFSVSEFTTQTLRLYSTDRVKVSLNDNEILSKTTTETELKSEPSLTKEITLVPGDYTISFSVLLSSENKTHYLKFDFTDSTFAPNTKNVVGGLTLDKMLEGRNIYSTEISGSGKYVIEKYYDLSSEGKSDYGYLICQKEDTTLTAIYSSNTYQDVHWLENSDTIYYVEEKNGSRSLCLQTPNGAKSILVEDLPDGTVSFLRGNNQYIILSQTSKVDKSAADLYHYQMPDDRIPDWRSRTNLVLFNIQTGQIQPLTYGNHNVYFLDYSPKTKTILFMVSYDSIKVRPFVFNSIYQMNLVTFKVDTLVNKDGFVSSAQYLPNANNVNDDIILTASGEAFSRLGTTLKKGVIPNSFNYLLYLMNNETKQIQCLTKGFIPSVKSVQITDNGRLFFLAENRDSVSFYEYDFKAKKIKHIDLACDVLLSTSCDANGENIAFVGQRYNDFSFLGLKTKDGSLSKRQEKSVKEQGLALGQMRAWNFKYKGTQIDGRLYLPYDFDSTKTYPLIVYYYGGTEPTDRSFQMRYSAYLYTAQGYAVYVINPSGTTGWGEEFAARHVNTWGDRTADEIIYGTKLLCKQHSFLDEKHIGCIGASYGGFMTMLLQTKTDIFACAISHAGISNIASYWGEGYWGYSYSTCATADSYPWNRKDIYVDKSPIFNANKIKTPMLLLQGTADTNVPIGESIQMFNALKILGKDVEYITVKGENHGIVDYSKRTQWQNVIFAYFAKYLKGKNSWWNSCTKDL